ncbi:MAG: hypothetical protein EOP24_25910 [Hyphomicrobiales bacterium]|nr:MAG: hypothetical protein EOP24_25910 [Hyphomicrobiales bacterium]
MNRGDTQPGIQAAAQATEDDAPHCAVCGEGAHPLPLVPVGLCMNPSEHVHHRCVAASGGEFAFCDVCGETVAHRTEDLHVHGEYVECSEHEGEFSSSSPEEEEDRESLAEYLLGHSPDESAPD